MRWESRLQLQKRLKKGAVKIGPRTLDWRSVTSIKKTAVMIRNDIRAGKVTFFKGMVLMIQARNRLKQNPTAPFAKVRLSALNEEIKKTRTNLMEKYGIQPSVERYAQQIRKKYRTMPGLPPLRM